MNTVALPNQTKTVKSASFQILQQQLPNEVDRLSKAIQAVSARQAELKIEEEKLKKELAQMLSISQEWKDTEKYGSGQFNLSRVNSGAPVLKKIDKIESLNPAERRKLVEVIKTGLSPEEQAQVIFEDINVEAFSKIYEIKKAQSRSRFMTMFKKLGVIIFRHKRISISAVKVSDSSNQ